MEKVKVEINLYHYEELSEEAQHNALIQHKEFLDSQEQEFENDKGELIKEFVDHDKEWTEESLKINEYLFFKNGEMADTLTYTGEHKKAGLTEFYFEDKTYTI